ncbi:MAG: hypothetical protein KF830_14255 [Planctomycetes bacterium]|nr:hypothetical protein [Planctomycetota bacterium]
MQAPYSTHDQTQSVGGEGGEFAEAWADIKTPGDGFQYAVGTIEVRDTRPGIAQFSDEDAIPASGIGSFLLPAPNRRQVVILQITEVDTQTIDRQRYYYGFTPDQLLRATNARGISVWAASSRADTRIAICGEAYDRDLPLSQASPAAASASAPSGFIAVFNGLGALLWTHHLFGVDTGGCCAVTDVSIRVDEEGSDVVTYCGISSHGVPAGTCSLAPVVAFPAFLGDSGGATDHGLGQWDGIVGRVTRTQAGVQNIDFHAIVGGPEQDGLFGIAEIEADRFAVVGGTTWAGSTPPPSGRAFPGLGSMPSPFDLGVAVVFAETPGGWVVDSSYPIGNSGEVHTLARDVLVLRDSVAQLDGQGNAAPAAHALVVVGSTNDANLFAGIAQPQIPAMQGSTDGFVLMLLDFPGFVAALLGRFHGGAGDDGLVGVQGWSEYADHFVVTGFTTGLGGAGYGTAGALDISVESFYVSTDATGPLPPAELRSLRQAWVSGSSVDRPAAMGVLHATSLGLAFDTGPNQLLGLPPGGGIAVDQRSRVNVVGQTSSSDYYQPVGGRSYDASLDAVRTVFDMIPPGVGRTDGTGDQGLFVLPLGFTGGTTPACALAEFGKRIGEPAPEVPRILLEYEGPQPQAGAAGATLLVIRPTAPIVPGALASSAIAAGFQFDFPGVNAPPAFLGDVEIFVTDNPSVFTIGFGYPNQSIIQPLMPLPTPPTVGQPMTVQVLCVVPVGVTGGCANTSVFTGSPAMWLPL